MRCLKLTILLISAILFSACVYHPPVQQGNIITEKELRVLHTGMSKADVRSTFGDPVLVNIYSDNRLVYVYTFQTGHKRMQSTRLIIYLSDDQVTHFWTDQKQLTASTRLPAPGART